MFGLVLLLLILQVSPNGGIRSHGTGCLILIVKDQGVRFARLAEVLNYLEVTRLGCTVEGGVTFCVFNIHEGLWKLGQKFH
jgi:hypothetical protein